jgi:hypothetical protein
VPSTAGNLECWIWCVDGHVDQLLHQGLRVFVIDLNEVGE